MVVLASAPSASATPASPAAHRGRRPAWKDPRVLVGALVVVACAVLGAIVMSGGASTTSVWSASRDLAAGADLSAADLVPVDVALGDSSAAYAEVAAGMPSGRLAVPLSAGELLPVSAMTSDAAADTRLITVPVEPLHGPIALAAGQRVDVWATPQESLDAGTVQPSLVLAGALVASVTVDESGATGDAGVVLEVPASDVVTIVDAVRSGVIDLVAVP